MLPMLNVLTVIDHLALGGAELMLGHFAAAAPDAGIHLSVTCLTERDGNPANEQLRAVGIEPVGLSIDRMRLHELRQLKHHIAQAQPDIVHTHLGTSDCLGGLAARGLGIPVVSTIHAMAWGGNMRSRVKDELTARARRHAAARIIAVSDSARRAYLSRGWAPADRVVTIRNGLDLVPATGQGARVRRELGFGPDDLVVGMVSALRPEKAHDLAIATIARLRDDFPRLRLLIAGQGASRDEIARLAAPHGAVVVLTGLRSDVMPVFDAIDICLHPSHADALPTTLIEAMAASVPVVATNVGGIPEIVDDGATGVLVRAPATVEDVARALALVLGDATLRAKLGAAGRRRYEAEFRAAPWMQRTRNLYDEVLVEVSRNHDRPERCRPPASRHNRRDAIRAMKQSDRT
jgi:glycosyltransferase involved in cell wall biosynthesis